VRALSVALAICLLAALGVAACAQTQQTISPAERFLFDAANRERASRGLGQLAWTDSLANAARQHAFMMAQRNTISHQFPGEPDLSERAHRAGVHFSALAENVAEAPSASDIHTGWMNSPPHRENLLDPGLDSIGIGVVERGGELFAAEDFSKSVRDLSIEDQEAKLDALLRAQGLRLVAHTDDARRVCSGGRVASGNPQPTLYFRFDTTDFDSLPDALVQKISTGPYHFGAGGACKGANQGEFTAYHLAVLLY